VQTARIRDLALGLPLLLAACAATNVTPVNTRHQLDLVCIERNPRVLVAALLPAVRDAFRRNRVPTVVREPGQLEGCETVLRYSARRAQGLARPYTQSATLELRSGDEPIGRLEWHASSVAFLGSTRTADQLDPLVDRLLAEQRP
jgi:hypothetical protein